MRSPLSVFIVTGLLFVFAFACSNQQVTPTKADSLDLLSITFAEEKVRFPKIAQLLAKDQFEEATFIIKKKLAKKSDTPLLHFYFALSLLGENRNREAYQYLSDQIVSYPERKQLYAYRGRVLMRLNYSLSAKEDFITARKLGLHSTQLLLDLALIEETSENRTAALVYIDDAINRDPSNSKLWHRKAQLEIKISNAKRALLSIKKAIAFDPENIIYYMFFVEVASFYGSNSALEEDLKKIHQQFPENPWFQLHLSRLLTNKGDFPGAETLLLTSINQHPTDTNLIFQMAGVLTSQSRLTEATEMYLRGLKQSPKSTWAKVRLARIYLFQKKHALGLQYLEEAIRGNTKNLFVYETVASMYNQRNETFTAEDAILKGLRIDSENPRLLTEYGNILEKRGNLNEAITAYRKLLLKAPTNFSIHGKLGNLYRLKKQYSESIQFLRKASELNPKSIWVRGYLAEVLIEMEQWSVALTELQLLQELEPKNYWPYAKQSLILKKIGRLQESLQYLDKAIPLGKNVPWLSELRGQILEQLGRYQDAAKAFESVLEERVEKSGILSQLAYVQLHLDKKKSLESVNKILDEDNADIISLELYHFVNKQYHKIWGFVEDSLEDRAYSLIMHKKFDQVKELLDELDKDESVHYPFLKYLSQLLQSGNKVHLQYKNYENRSDLSQWHYYYLGIAAMADRDNVLSKSFFDQGLSINPNNHWIKIKLSVVEEESKNYDRAIRLLKDFLLLRPGNVWADHRLALNFDLAKQPFNSEKVYLRIISKNRNDNLALNNLAWLYLTTDEKKLQKIEEALELSKKAVKISPSSANLDTLAEAFFLTKQYQKALKTIEQALDRDRKSLDYFKKQKKKILKALKENKISISE